MLVFVVVSMGQTVLAQLKEALKEAGGVEDKVNRPSYEPVLLLPAVLPVLIVILLLGVT